MPRATFGKKWGRVRTSTVSDKSKDARRIEDVVRDLKKDQQRTPGEDYRERSLALGGLICARCGREFDESKRHLLTVHHKDGNHHNNPLDGSNWENLCVYCHDNEHRRYTDHLEGEMNESGAAKPEAALKRAAEKAREANEAFSKELEAALKA